MDQESPSAAYAEADDGEMNGEQEPTDNLMMQAMQSGDDEEEFVPDPDMETLDLSGQYIDDLEPLISLVFQKMPKLRELNLSNNMISSLPMDLCRNYLPQLEQINLNGNQISQDEQAFS